VRSRLPCGVSMASYATDPITTSDIALHCNRLPLYNGSLGIESAFLRKLPGLIFVLLGVLSQIYIGRRMQLPRTLLHCVVGIYAVACLFLSFEVINDPPQPLNFYWDDIGAALTMFGWMTVVIAIVILLRSHVPARFSDSRRQFLNVTATAVCAAPAIALATGILTRKDFQVKEIDLKIPGLPKDLQGLRLLQLSDIHMGAFFSPADLRRVVDASNGLRADLGFITGDLITGMHDPLDACLLELKRLKTASGLWGCMGNHEKLAKVAGYTAAQGRKQNLFFLRHESQSLRFGDSRINLVGVDHQFKHEGYLIGVEELVKPGEFNLLLSHNPDVFPVSARKGFQLTLAGHTHGGQINIEVANTNLNIVDFVTPYTKGLYQKPGSSLYVTSGLGTIGVPVRLGAPPEITLLRLCAS
jgi:predicted MPP superfamily phosphohydrolase